MTKKLFLHLLLCHSILFVQQVYSSVIESGIIKDFYTYEGYSQNGNGCPNEEINSNGTLNDFCTTPAPTITNDGPIFCNSAFVSDFETGENILLWYEDEIGGIALSADTPLVDSMTYYASQIDGCESTARTPVTVHINTPQAPMGEAVQGFCNIGTVGDFITDNGSIWYDAASEGNILPGDTPLVNLQTYFVAHIFDGCESIDRLPVQAILYITLVDVLSDVSTCSGYVLPNLENGDYFMDMGGASNMLSAGTTITETTTIYIYNEDGTNPTCSNESSFNVTITDLAPPIGDETQILNVGIPEEATIEDIIIEGTGTVTWYASEEDAANGQNALPEGTVLITGEDYFATLTDGDCVSDSFKVTVDVVLGKDDFHKNTFSYYPNPVKDILNISYTSAISSVELYNMIGQQVIKKEINQKDSQIDTSALPAGAYLLKVSAEDASKTIKIIKQ